MLAAMDISRSALVAQRVRMDVIAGNIANAHSTRQEDGTVQPYRRRFVTLAPGDGAGGAGVHVGHLAEDPSPFQLKYDPGHPDAIPSGPQAGYVQLPNVNVTLEYIDAIAASRAYEANVAMLNASRGMVEQSLRLFA
jgi:flagellar basal-body rod protein FlgC